MEKRLRCGLAVGSWFLLLIACFSGMVWAAEAQPVMNELGDKLTLGGKIEVEAGYASIEPQAGKKVAESDIVTATAELDLGITLSEKVHGTLNLLWEEDESEGIMFDEATITLGDFKGFSLKGGRETIPFGRYESFFISDPLTLELGETTHKSVVEIFYVLEEKLKVSVGTFNGNFDQANKDDRINDYYAALEFSPFKGLLVGGSYLSDFAESGAELIGGYDIVETDEVKYFKKGVGAYSGFLSLNFSPVLLEAEAVSAIDRFGLEDLDMNQDGKGDRPLTWNVEAAVQLLEEKLMFAARYGGAQELYDYPESLLGITGRYKIFPNTSLALETQYASFDKKWSAKKNETTVLGQLAVEF